MVGNGEPVDELVLPYHGERLRGSGIRRRLEAWADAGIIEPSVGEAVGLVLDNPDWLRLDGHTVAVLGAGAEMGPLPSLMRWGARVAAVDLGRPEIWKRLLPMAKEGAGSLIAPVRPRAPRARSTSQPASTCSATYPRSSSGCASSRARW